MSDRKKCPWWRGHAWRTDGLTGPLSMQETCARCGLVKVFNGALDETEYFWPARRDEEKR